MCEPQLQRAPTTYRSKEQEIATFDQHSRAGRLVEFDRVAPSVVLAAQRVPSLAVEFGVCYETVDDHGTAQHLGHSLVTPQSKTLSVGIRSSRMRVDL